MRTGFTVKRDRAERLTRLCRVLYELVSAETHKPMIGLLNAVVTTASRTIDESLGYDIGLNSMLFSSLKHDGIAEPETYRRAALRALWYLERYFSKVASDRRRYMSEQGVIDDIKALFVMAEILYELINAEDDRKKLRSLRQVVTKADSLFIQNNAFEPSFGLYLLLFSGLKEDGSIVTANVYKKSVKKSLKDMESKSHSPEQDEPSDNLVNYGDMLDSKTATLEDAVKFWRRMINLSQGRFDKRIASDMIDVMACDDFDLWHKGTVKQPAYPEFREIFDRLPDLEWQPGPEAEAQKEWDTIICLLDSLERKIGLED